MNDAPLSPLTFVPVTPAWLWIALAVLGVLALGHAHRAAGLHLGRGDAWLLLTARGLLLAAPLWLLAGPGRWHDQATHRDPVPVVLLVDASASMATQDVDTPARSRWEVVKQWLRSAELAQFETQQAMQRWQFSEHLQPLPRDLAQVTPAGSATHLWAAVRAAPIHAGWADRPGVLVVASDGHDTQQEADPTLVDSFRSAGWRVLALPVGQTQPTTDVQVEAWVDQPRLLPGDRTTLRARVQVRGSDTQRVHLTWRREDQMLHEQELELDDTGSVQTQLAITADPTTMPAGQTIGFRVQVTALPGEQDLTNNARWVFVQVLPDPVRVLLLEGAPNWDTQALAAALGADRNFALTGVHQLAPERRLIQQPALGSQVTPLRADLSNLDWRDYDVIVLGRALGHLLTEEQWQALGAHLHAGGLAVFAGGQPRASGEGDWSWLNGMPWLRGAPRGRVWPTDIGLQEMIWRLDVPLLPARALSVPGRDPLLGVVNEAERTFTPLLWRQRVGQGQALCFVSQGWASSPQREGVLDDIHLRRLLRWLVSGSANPVGIRRLLRVEPTPAQVGETILLTLDVREAVGLGDTMPVTLTTPDGQTQELILQRSSDTSLTFSAPFTPSQAGVHALTTPTAHDEPIAQTRFEVLREDPEMRDPSARPGPLLALAQATGGAVLDWRQPGQLRAHLRPMELARTPIPKWRYHLGTSVVLALLLIGAGVGWAVRRQEGLP